MYKKVFITGSSGWIGSNLCFFLEKKGYNVKGIDIRTGSFKNTKLCDINDKDKLLDILEEAKPDILIHCAAKLEGDRFLLNKVNIDGTKNVVDVAKKINVKKFIHISSCAVYSGWKKGKITEETSLRAIEDYGRSKIESEKIVSSLSNYIILRPTNLYGRGRSKYCFLFKNTQIKIFFYIEGNAWHLLYLDDLIDMIYCGIKRDNIGNEIFILADDEEKYNTKKVYEILCSLKKEKLVPKIKVPNYFLNLFPFLRKKVSMDQRFFSNEKFKKFFSYKLSVGTEKGLARYYEWCIKGCPDI